jgi:hypothetical protein
MTHKETHTMTKKIDHTSGPLAVLHKVVAQGTPIKGYPVGQSKILRLFRQDGSWVVDHTYSQDAQEIRRLFKTTILPTPYLSSMPVEDVLTNLQKLNPDHLIIVA